MNLIALIALILSCIAVAISVCAVYAVRTKRQAPSRGFDTLFRQEPEIGYWLGPDAPDPGARKGRHL